MNFDEAFIRLIGHEGGYVDHPDDPGGETKFGISKRAHPTEDIKGMTLDRAKKIYLRDYWGPAGCDAVPDRIKFDLFDMAVNMGTRKAIRALQEACGAEVDGVLGPRTLLALNACPSGRLAARFNGVRLLLYTNLPTWPTFGRGWARRVADNLLEI
jgi:lysozyme family protein